MVFPANNRASFDKLMTVLEESVRRSPARALVSALPTNAAAPSAVDEAPTKGAPSTFSRGDAPWSQVVSAFAASRRAAAPASTQIPVLFGAAVAPAPGLTSTAPLGNTAAPATPAAPAAPPTVTTKTEHHYGPTPWVWNQWLPGNGGKDSAEYKHWKAMNGAAEGVGTTYSKLEGAKKLEVGTKAAADAAQAARDTAAAADPSGKAPAAVEKALVTSKKAHVDAQAATVKAQKGYDAAVAKVATTSTEFKAFLTKQLPTIHAQDKIEDGIRGETQALTKALAAEKAKKPDARQVAKLEREIAALERRIGKSASPSAEDTKALSAKLQDLATAKAVAPDPAKVKDLTDQIAVKKTELATRKTALEAEIAAYQPIQAYDRKISTVKIDGKTITLSDHAQAYSSEAPGGLSGRGIDGGATGVAAALASSKSLSASDQKIVKAISKFVGNLSSTESYDNGGLTWGMLQWTTGKDGGGSVIGVMKRAKHSSAAAYKSAFQDHGIDIENGKLKVTTPTGSVLKGAAAVEYVRNDPVMSAAFVAAGTNKDIQLAQLESAKHDKMDSDGLNRSATVEVNGKKYTFKAREVFTSEYGAALVANAGVHAGGRRTAERLEAGLVAFFKAHPEADPTKPATWAAQAEAEMAAKMAGGDSDRAAYYQANLDGAAGSYKP